MYNTNENTILKLRKNSIITIVVLIFFLGFQTFAQTPVAPEKPKFQTSVYDDAGLLNAEQKSALEQKLIKYADSTSTQIVIATILTTNGEEISYYATNFAHKWGIGQADKDNGVLILVAKDDRKMTIQVGYGLEHILTDALSRRIIETVMTPFFKQGDYYGGLNEATNVMFQIFSGEYKNDKKEEINAFPFIFMVLFFIIFIIIVAKASKNSGGKGGSITTGDFFGPIILSSGGRGGFGGGFGGGSSGGGGFSGGFGGGGFGGGGASGGW